MITEEEENEIANILKTHRREIFKIIDELLENHGEYITSHCEKMECDKCKIGKSLNDLKIIHCWTSSKQFER